MLISCKGSVALQEIRQIDKAGKKYFVYLLIESLMNFFKQSNIDYLKAPTASASASKISKKDVSFVNSKTFLTEPATLMILRPPWYFFKFDRLEIRAPIPEESM